MGGWVIAFLVAARQEHPGKLSLELPISITQAEMGLLSATLA